MSTKQTDDQIPYGIDAMQEVTEEMSASKLTCISGLKLRDGSFKMDDIKTRPMASSSSDSLESLA